LPLAAPILGSLPSQPIPAVPQPAGVTVTPIPALNSTTAPNSTNQQ
jgi:hypothetical protein